MRSLLFAESFYLRPNNQYENVFVPGKSPVKV
jgi:hypothetical protein